ncbi:hypothetical protein B566_EDAN010301 [Ephemera danica]|nr:hypothetical protein B566_EDAN010301 [Ephemera danica]
MSVSVSAETVENRKTTFILLQECPDQHDFNTKYKCQTIYMANPADDCTFYICNPNSPTLMFCPQSTYFDPVKLECDFITNANRTLKCPSTETTPAPVFLTAEEQWKRYAEEMIEFQRLQALHAISTSPTMATPTYANNVEISTTPKLEQISTTQPANVEVKITDEAAVKTEQNVEKNDTNEEIKEQLHDPSKFEVENVGESPVDSDVNTEFRVIEIVTGEKLPSPEKLIDAGHGGTDTAVEENVKIEETCETCQGLIPKSDVDQTKVEENIHNETTDENEIADSEIDVNKTKGNESHESIRNLEEKDSDENEEILVRIGDSTEESSEESIEEIQNDSKDGGEVFDSSDSELVFSRVAVNEAKSSNVGVEKEEIRMESGPTNVDSERKAENKREEMKEERKVRIPYSIIRRMLRRRAMIIRCCGGEACTLQFARTRAVCCPLVNLINFTTEAGTDGTDAGTDATTLAGNDTTLAANGTTLAPNGTTLAANGTTLAVNGTTLAANGTTTTRAANVTTTPCPAVCDAACYSDIQALILNETTKSASAVPVYFQATRLSPQTNSTSCNFTYTDGSALNYTNWATGEPQTTLRCSAIVGGKWITSACTPTAINFLCRDP